MTVASKTLTRFPIRESAMRTFGEIRQSLPMRGRALDDDGRGDDRFLADADAEVDPGRGGIDDRDAGGGELPDLPEPEDGGRDRQVVARPDLEELFEAPGRALVRRPPVAEIRPTMSPSEKEPSPRRGTSERAARGSRP